MEPTAEFAHLQLRFTDQTQRRYEVIRPLLLFEDRTATQRAQETETHPDTVRTFLRRFRQQGMLGLLPDHVEMSPRGRASRVPEAVRQEIARLNALYSKPRQNFRDVYGSLSRPYAEARTLAAPTI